MCVFVYYLSTISVRMCMCRDKNEELMQLSEEKKAELQQRENVRYWYCCNSVNYLLGCSLQLVHCSCLLCLYRMARSGSSTFYSPRKEKALKIYTDDLPAKSAG
jgi:hypothetical protein